MTIKERFQLVSRRPATTALLCVPLVLAGIFLWIARDAAHLKTDTLRLAQEIMMTGLEAKRAGALFSQPPRDARIVKVTATAYSPGEEQTDASPWRGALGLRIRPGRTLAVSQDLRDLLGRRVFIKGFGFRVVEDLMHERWSKRADFCVSDRDKAASFGVQDIELVIVD